MSRQFRGILGQFEPGRFRSSVCHFETQFNKAANFPSKRNTCINSIISVFNCHPRCPLQIRVGQRAAARFFADTTHEVLLTAHRYYFEVREASWASWRHPMRLISSSLHDRRSLLHFEANFRWEKMTLRTLDIEHEVTKGPALAKIIQTSVTLLQL